ncbi:MAG: hypothetical protein ACSLE2_16430 [Lysobacterales bacterium]
MLQKIKQEFREVKSGKPGKRFVDHFHRIRGRENGRGTFWMTFAYVAVGLLLVICGFVLSLPPGVPGFLLWIPGLVLLAARSKSLATLLDRLESWGRHVWQKYVTQR